MSWNDFETGAPQSGPWGTLQRTGATSRYVETPPFHGIGMILEVLPSPFPLQVLREVPTLLKHLETFGVKNRFASY